MPFRFLTADVFTNTIFGGNPLAVFPDAAGIPEADLPRIARELNLSETVFVLPPQDAAHTRRLRIFTPAGEIPFAGHPTVGAAFVLAALGEVTTAGSGAELRVLFEEQVGVVPVDVRLRSAYPVFAQLTTAKLPEVGPPAPGRSVLANMLSLEPGDLLGGMNAPQAVSCGLPFLFVPVRDRNVVARARVRLDHWESILKSYWAPQLMVFSRDGERAGSDIHARVFVPGLSVPEDPATGSAAAALGGYLAAREAPAESGQLRYIVEQGLEMGRPSILHVEVDRVDGQVTAIRVGGECVMVAEGAMRGAEDVTAGAPPRS
ncbi:MAG TPA: PhzF family phenazine biosynthesis protein [Gemmatimonadaceae bacterium]|nr:PhzF family phenazine biosynthesis protein [Gemmatimonadaceae bacterium]